MMAVRATSLTQIKPRAADGHSLLLGRRNSLYQLSPPYTLLHTFLQVTIGGVLAIMPYYIAVARGGITTCTRLVLDCTRVLS